MKLTNLILTFNKANSTYPETLEEMKYFGENIYGMSYTVYEISQKTEKFFKTEKTYERRESYFNWKSHNIGYKEHIHNIGPIDECFSSEGLDNLEAAKKLYLGIVNKKIDSIMSDFEYYIGNNIHIPIKNESFRNKEEVKKFKSNIEAKINTFLEVFNEEHDGDFERVYQTNLREKLSIYTIFIDSEGFSDSGFCRVTVREYFDQLRRVFDKNVEKDSPLYSEFEKIYAKNTEEMKKKNYSYYKEMGELPIIYKKLKAYCTEKELDFDLLMANSDSKSRSGFKIIFAPWVNSVIDLKLKSNVFDSDVREFLKRIFKNLRNRIEYELKTYFSEIEVLKSECEALSNIKNNFNVRENFSGYYGVLLNIINTLEKYVSNYKDCGVYIKKLKEYSQILARFA